MFLPVCSADDLSAAQKLRRNGSHDAGAERERNQRIEGGLIVPGAKPSRHEDDRRRHYGRSGQDESCPGCS